MKIIHCGDIHLDSKMETNLSKEKARERKNEILMTFLNMIHYAKDNLVDIIIIAGDLFDSKRVSIKTKNIIYNSIKSNPHIEFLYLSGNHDSDNFIAELEEIPDNLKLFNDEWTSYKYADLTITGIELYPGNSNSIYNMLILDKNETNIVVMHGQESKHASKGKDEIINISELKNRNIDYLALGHIHSYKYEKLDSRGAYCYSGCLEGRGFDELGDKGFVLLNIQDKKISHEFIKFARRTFYEISVDISNMYTTTQIEEVLYDNLAHTSRDSLVKILLKGEFEIDSEKDISYITQKLSEEFYFIKIYDKTKLSIKIEDYKYDVSLKGEFIRLVLNARLSEEDKKEIIINGINALSGEDID